MTKTKEVSETQGTFPTEVPAFLKNSGAGRGNEDVGVKDVTIPRISIIQDLSPYHKKSKPEYIEGAETGMAFNTVSGDLYGAKLYVVPVYFRMEYLVWRDQAKGGGFAGDFPNRKEAEAARLELEDANDHESVDTAQHFVIIVDEKGKVIEDAVISMSKSQMKPSRAFNTQIRMAAGKDGGDRFSRVYELSIIEEQNKAGKDYFNWAVKPKGYVTEETFRVAEAMYKSVIAGTKGISRSVEAVGDDKPQEASKTMAVEDPF